MLRRNKGIFCRTEGSGKCPSCVLPEAVRDLLQVREVRPKYEESVCGTRDGAAREPGGRPAAAPGAAPSAAKLSGAQRRERRSPATGGGTGELVMAGVGSGRQRLFSR